MVGLYLDALSDAQRDRVIEVPEFGNGVYVDNNGLRCLVGVAEREHEFPPVQATFGYRRRRDGKNQRVCDRFDALCRRFGKHRITRLVKARAAKGNVVREIRDGIYQDHRDRAESDARLVPHGGMYGSTLL